MNWTSAADYQDIRYELSGDGIAKITINRPEVRNAFRPETIIEISDALEKAREDETVGVIILTGEGPLAFCSGGDQRVRGDTGYVPGGKSDRALPRHRPARPDPARCRSRSWRWSRATRSAAGTILHLVCDLTIAADNAQLRADRPPRRLLRRRLRGEPRCSRLVGPKKAKEFWFLCRLYDAQQALDMGLVNTVVPLDQLEEETVKWCHEMLALSPFALRLRKAFVSR